MTIEQEHLGVHHVKNAISIITLIVFFLFFFHNLAGYDSHHIIKQAYDICEELMETIPARYDRDDPEGSYTTRRLYAQ